MTLGTLQESVNAIQSAQGQLMSDLNLLKDRVPSNADTLLGISTKQESFARNFDKVDGEIHDINCKIEEMEQGMANNTFMINSLYERLLALERYSRGFNLRFYKVPEQTGEDCIVTLGKIISKDLKQKPVIENAHRVGPSRDDGSPRPIIAKFLYRPDRRDILRNKKLFKNGTYVSEDLIPEDRKRKNDLKAVNDLNFVMENFILMASLIIVSCSDNSPWYDIIFCFIGIIYFAILYLLFRY